MVGKAIFAAIWFIVVGWPAVSLLLRPGGAPDAPHAGPLHDAWSLLWVTLCWSAGVAAAAVVAAVPAARYLASQPSNRLAWLAAWLLVGLLLPPWAVYYTWWSIMPPGSWLHELAVSNGDVGMLRRGVLGVAMVSWTWPVAVCCLLPVCMRWTRDRSESMRLDGASWWRRQGARLRTERAGVVVASIVTLLLTAGCTTAFDLAGVFTIANELRARGDLGASGGALVAASLPLATAAVLGAGVLWIWVGRPAPQRLAPAAVSRGAAIVAMVLFGLLVGAPLVLVGFMWIRVQPGEGLLVWPAVGTALARSLLVGAVSAALVAATRGVWKSRLANVAGWTWVAAALLPAPLIGAAVAAGWRGAFGGVVMNSGGAWTLGLLVRGGAVAVLTARWIHRTQSDADRSLRAIDAAAWWHLSPVVSAGMLGAGLVAMTMAMTDISLAASLAPPMRHPPLATTMLNAIHYQRPDSVVRLLAWIAAAAVASCLGIRVLLRCGSRGVSVASMLAILVLIPACGTETTGEADPPVPHASVTGLPGRAPGRFDTPRAIAVDAEGAVYVVDKSARVQRLRGGEVDCLWTMPAWDNGKPTGLGVFDEGVAVADTHEYRVTVFDRCGTLVRTFGRYGTGPGEFIYPTDVAVSPGGAWFVSEYGGNDRVQVFDAAGHVIRSIGSPGSEPGQFHRPQSLAFSLDGSVLWVADSGNHRIQGIDPATGAVLAVIGQGHLRYPYGVAALPDGSIVVTEYGLHRLSRWSATGTPLGLWGGWGAAAGRLRMPWGVCYDAAHDAVHVLDTGNARIMTVPRGALGSTDSAAKDPPGR